MTVAAENLSHAGHARAKSSSGSPGKKLLIAVFCAVVVLPIVIQAGPLRLSPMRIFLAITLIPTILVWLMGGAGRIRIFDFLMIGYVTWCNLALCMTDGFEESREAIGSWTIETLGAYFLARCCVRDEMTFRFFAKVYVMLALTMLPFAAAESLLGRPVLLDLFARGFAVIPVVDMEARMGMRRAQAVFEHPILYGMFIAGSFSLSWYVWSVRGGKAGRIIRSPAIGLATLFSLSTGAIVAMACQVIMIGWDLVSRSLKRRWTVFFGIVAFYYVLIDTLSNRSPVEVFIEYLTFNIGSAYNRVLIWEYGTVQVWQTPWWGIGLKTDWERPWWMHSGSIDNFWLVIAVKYGLPAFLLLASAILLIKFRVGLAKLEPLELVLCRRAYLISLIGIAVGICTVHLWTNTYVHYMFLLASGVWLLEHGAASPPEKRPQV